MITILSHIEYHLNKKAEVPTLQGSGLEFQLQNTNYFTGFRLIDCKFMTPDDFLLIGFTINSTTPALGIDKAPIFLVLNLFQSPVPSTTSLMLSWPTLTVYSLPPLPSQELEINTSNFPGFVPLNFQVTKHSELVQKP